MSSSLSSSQERRKVGMLVPPPILLAVLALLSLAAHLVWQRYIVGSPVGIACGTAVVAASLALLGWSARAFKQAGTPVRPTSQAVSVVGVGPYRFSRNPMYVAMAGLLVGFGLLTGSWLFAAAAVVFLLVVHFGVVLPEESYMESLHGETYRQFKQQVRRWL